MGELISACKLTFQSFGYFWNLWFFQVWKQLVFLSAFNLRFFQVFLRLITVILSFCNLKKHWFGLLMLSSFSAIVSNWKNLRLNLRKSRVEPEKISGLNFSFNFFIVSSWEADDKYSVAMLQFKFSNKPEFFSGLNPNQILPKD